MVRKLFLIPPNEGLLWPGARGVMSLRAAEHPGAVRDKWVLGGLHMTANSFVPASLLKVTQYIKEDWRDLFIMGENNNQTQDNAHFKAYKF